jgi:N-acetylglucosamine kinase-like BadF-type ATPase
MFMGLDCGGSSCRAVVVDEIGSILHQGQAGPANLASTPPGKIQSHVIRASKEGPQPDFVCACFAGLLIQDDRSRALDMLRQVFPRAELRAEPDYYAALMASDSADICVIAGTGSLVCSRIGSRVVKSGGRGYILGDAGSAYQYGRAAMLHFLDSEPDDVSEALRKTILDRFASLSENEVLAKLYRGGIPAAQLAKLATVFGKDARAGAPYALSCLSEQSMGLAKIIARHAERYFSGHEDLSLALAGGLWDGTSVYRTALESALGELMPKFSLKIERITRPPVQGAVQLAREMKN